jgi:hypothetical protein
VELPDEDPGLPAPSSDGRVMCTVAMMYLFCSFFKSIFLFCSHFAAKACEQSKNGLPETGRLSLML